MRSQRMAVVLLVLLAAGGCRTDPAVTMLERENRQLEDVIYQQRDVIEDYRRTLDEMCRPGVPTSAGTSPSFEGPSLAPPEPARPPRRSTAPPTSRSGPPTKVEPPVIEIPEHPVPSDQVPDTLRLPPGGSKPGVEAPPFVPPSGSSGPAKARVQGVSIRSGNTEVAQITLADVVAWGSGTAQTSGESGISLVVQPRNAAGRPVLAAAGVSIVVLDPAVSGQAARVARWDFSAEEVARLLGDSPTGDGLHLEMVWPAGRPMHNRLHLFVRYTGDDGRKVEADQPIDLNAPAILPQGPDWQPAGPELSATDARRPATQPQSSPTRSAARSPQPLRTAAAPPRTPTPAPARRPRWSPDRL